MTKSPTISGPAPEPPSKLLDYLRLFRLPNVFTAMADVAMGFCFVSGSLDHGVVLLCLLAASSLMYTAGMVLNDVYDVEIDARERPQRPLPSGRISVSWARWLGYEMLLVGAALGWLSGYLVSPSAAISWRAGAVSTVLAVCVIAYDKVLKKTWLGPLGMGSCRFLNVLLGMSVALAATGPTFLLGYTSAELIVAGGLGLYIVGVTIFARGEADVSRRGVLTAGLAVMMLGMVLLALYPQFDEADRFRLRWEIAWPVLLVMICFSIVRRCAEAVADPSPVKVQMAVKHAILSLIVLNASICLSVSGADQIYWPLGVLALLAPTLVLGRWVYST